MDPFRIFHPGDKQENKYESGCGALVSSFWIFIRWWVVDIVLETARRVSREDLREFHLFFMVLITIFVHKHMYPENTYTQCISIHLSSVNLYLSLIMVVHVSARARSRVCVCAGVCVRVLVLGLGLLDTHAPVIHMFLA